MRNLMIALLAMAFANGCFFLPFGSWGDDDEEWYYEEHTVDGRIQGAVLYGDMYDIGTFEGDAYDAEYIGGYGSSTITLHAGENGGDDFGWAMIGLTTYAEDGFEGDTFAPGQTITADDGLLDAQGCTGPRHGDWDFDGHSQDVVVTVEEGASPDIRVFHVYANFDQSNGGVTEATFELQLPSGGERSTGIVDDL